MLKMARLLLVKRLIGGFDMLDKLRCIDIAIGTCNFWLQKAEDSKNVDSFNYWFAERERYFRERANLLSIKLGV